MSGLVILASLALTPAAVLGQSASRGPVEVFAAVGVAGASSGELFSSYEPVLELSIATSSAAEQELTLAPRRAAAIQGGIRYFFRPAFGLEFRAAYASGELDGVNTPYRVELSYIARLPPDFIPRPEHYENATPWPDTSGYLHRVMLAGNLVGRVSRGRVTAAMTGGFAWQRISGDAEPLGYTLFRLGGRSVLFVFDHQVSVRLQPASGPGFDVGGEVGFDLGRRVAFVSGLQVFGGPALMPDVQVDALRSSDPFPAATIDEIRAVLRPGPARVPFTTTVLMFGITVH